MGIISYIGAIAASVNRKNKLKTQSAETVGSMHPIHSCTKEQYLKWIEEGKCGCCGAESGECRGICDECRWS